MRAFADVPVASVLDVEDRVFCWFGQDYILHRLQLFIGNRLIAGVYYRTLKYIFNITRLLLHTNTHEDPSRKIVEDRKRRRIEEESEQEKAVADDAFSSSNENRGEVRL